ncbi:26362_t:CDS:2, partial [Racocetra persica]
HILGINTLLVTLPSNLPALNELKSNKTNIDSLNTTAIYEQEFKEFLESTLRKLYNKSNQRTLLTHLLGLVTSDSFKEALDLNRKPNNIESSHTKAKLSGITKRVETLQ